MACNRVGRCQRPLSALQGDADYVTAIFAVGAAVDVAERLAATIIDRVADNITNAVTDRITGCASALVGRRWRWRPLWAVCYLADR